MADDTSSQLLNSQVVRSHQPGMLLELYMCASQHGHDVEMPQQTIFQSCHSNKNMLSTVFITGANSGVGLATSKVFLSHGWNVVGTARDPSAAVDLQKLSSTAEDRFGVAPLDVALSTT
jgi:hypothetical protein